MEPEPLRHYIIEDKGPPPHQPCLHQFKLAVTDMTIARWCPDCGKTWVIIRYAQGGMFTTKWEEIKEADVDKL